MVGKSNKGWPLGWLGGMTFTRPKPQLYRARVEMDYCSRNATIRRLHEQKTPLSNALSTKKYLHLIVTLLTVIVYFRYFLIRSSL
jgi:hypothetical protein